VEKIHAGVKVPASYYVPRYLNVLITMYPSIVWGYCSYMKGLRKTMKFYQDIQLMAKN